jgi:hypothetical protein
MVDKFFVSCCCKGRLPISYKTKKNVICKIFYLFNPVLPHNSFLRYFITCGLTGRQPVTSAIDELFGRYTSMVMKISLNFCTGIRIFRHKFNFERVESGKNAQTAVEI